MEMGLEELLFQVTRPARYTGGEWNSVARDWDRARLRFALVYPDLYEIGMSNLAVHILYHLLNSLPGVLCERAFVPWVDMAAQLRRQRLPLFSLESRRPLRDFDVLGFSLGYELSYTNMLEVLSLAGIPLRAEERGADAPIVIAGGTCSLNPEPVADFVDLFLVGEGEEALPELVAVLADMKGAPRRQVLLRAAETPGVYVPSFYRPLYRRDVSVEALEPLCPQAKPRVERRLLSTLPPPTTNLIVPYVEVVHDRGMVEIQRGCARGCRFCQAGVIYRPVRERPADQVVAAVGEVVARCGYQEVALLSLSTSDYHGIEGVVAEVSRRYPDLLLSLPSLSLDQPSVRLLEAISREKKKGLTFAPEAGTERLRLAINKGLAEEQILKTLSTAFERGWTGVKLYFMLGLPTETEEDVAAIPELVSRIVKLGPRKSRPRVKVSLSPFVPRPHTPFQWVRQVSIEEMETKSQQVRQGLRGRGVQLSGQPLQMSLLEGVLSRGDRQLGEVILNAWRLGGAFDAWRERFDFSRWLLAFAQAGVEPAAYTRERSPDEPLPWDHIGAGVSPAFLRREFRRTFTGRETPDCHTGPCSACGLHQLHPACREKFGALAGTKKAAEP